MVPLRFEVTLNSRILCTAGMDKDGILMVTLQSENLPAVSGAEPFPGASSRGTPGGKENTVSVVGYTDADDTWQWIDTPIGAGDQILIRVLPNGSFDPPTVVPPIEDG